MKLEFLSFDFDKFAQEMQNLKDKKGFDYRGRPWLCLYP